MALLVMIEMSTLWFAVSTLSAVRAYVGGEGLWSKAEKDAVYHLRVYADSHNEKDYQAFLNFLKVPLGDRKTRIELQKANPDLQIARQGFIEGRNHPEDVDGMINLIRRFNTISYLHKAIIIWGQAEGQLELIIPLGEKMHDMISSGTGTQQEINDLRSQAENINQKLTSLEDEFSFTLGQGSRWMEKIVLRLLLTLSLTIATTSILITISVSKGIEKGLKAILDGASFIAQGFLNTRVKVYSHDEIGQLAVSFNQMTDTLERYIRELKDTEENLKRAKERAEISEKAKQLFLAKMSHEIRTPMNGILGFAKLLEESLREKEQQEYIRVIIKSGDDLLVILNDILDFSRMEAGKITFESAPVNLKDIIHSTVIMIESKAKQKNIDIETSIDEKIPAEILGDPVRLNQILLNLVSNAVKFTEKGKITIAVNCIGDSKDRVLMEFSVKDTGIGIHFEKQVKIFESFEQAVSDTTRRFGGTGLGLSIVKQLVELQGGEIFVNSKPGQGSDFYFRLSFLKEKANKRITESEKAEITSPENKALRVLVVEDNPINRLLAIKVLQNQGFETDIAENGKIALEKYKKQDYDIILMDLQMPEMDGYETTINIRELKTAKKDIPIIAMTAHTIKGELERCMEIGMNDFISKPFDKKDLYEKIYKAISKSMVMEFGSSHH
jgi:signal transduction histidine kinase/CheY-like chemotaxis protein